jgi:hypothetical protein
MAQALLSLKGQTIKNLTLAWGEVAKRANKALAVSGALVDSSCV